MEAVQQAAVTRTSIELTTTSDRPEPVVGVPDLAR
jgi:hypothetical protein